MANVLQILWHLLHLLQNCSALKTGPLKHLTSDMMVKLKDGFGESCNAILWHIYEKPWHFLIFFIMVTFNSKMYFGYTGKESVS